VLAVVEASAQADRESGASTGDAASPDAGDLPADPVFMFGWPGSGWEWLAAGLGAHPDVMLVADVPETQAGRRSLISSPKSQAAGQYWEDLKSGQLEPGARTTLDTMWISADMLPVIDRLFPAARVIVVNRDPRDMVLDWFRSGYADLDDMATIYKNQIDALARHREQLEIGFIDVDGNAIPGDTLSELRVPHGGHGPGHSSGPRNMGRLCGCTEIPLASI
jgi:hypothetical protein